MQSRLYDVSWKVLDLLFPPRCGGCKRWGTRWCDSCQEEVQVIGEEGCPRCGEPHPGGSARLYVRCQTEKQYFDTLRSWAYFKGPVKEAVYELKYHHNIGLGERLAKELVKLIESLRWKCDMVIPLPLGSERLKERGYNQAMLLAGPIAWDLHLPLQRQAVKRVKETQSQVGLSRRQRIGNVRQAFDAEPLYVTGKQILLVDDVVTTGATINACAKALKDAKAESVYGLTLARSIHLY